MRNFSTNKRLIVILIVVILFFAIIAFSLGNYGQPNAAQQATNDVTGWVARGVTGVSHSVENLFDSINDLKNTYQENKRLKAHTRDYQETKAELEATRLENENLKSELELKNTLSEYETLSATVISRSPNEWLDTLIIDKGGLDGIEKDMPVLSSGGLIGRISEVNDRSAKVTLLTTANQRADRVSAQILAEDEKKVEGIVEGYSVESGRLVMDQITVTDEIEEGQKVMTSGLTGKTPSALPIGRVDEIQQDEFGLTQKAYLVPYADFKDIRFVTVIQRLADTVEEVEADD